MEMDRLLTVLVQTSPIPSHPSTSLIEALFRSFDRADGLKESRIVIVCDGHGYEEEDNKQSSGGDVARTGEEINKQNSNNVSKYKHGDVSSDANFRYREFLRRLRSNLSTPPFAPPVGTTGSVELLELKERHGSARAIQAAFDVGVVKTPYVMIAQHDNLFVNDCPLRGVLTALEQRGEEAWWLKCLHFQAAATVDYAVKVKKRYRLDLRSRTIEGIGSPLVPLAFWYGRTHLARTDYYTSFVLNRVLRKGDHLEELLGLRQLEDMKSMGVEAGHEVYGNYVLDQTQEVLYHLSGRRARAAPEGAEEENRVDRVGGGCNNSLPSGQAPYASNGAGGSYTTARCRRAVVPGLILPPLPSKGVEAPRPQGRFRQRCFNCGERGHSYRWCPQAQTGEGNEVSAVVLTETIDLS